MHCFFYLFVTYSILIELPWWLSWQSIHLECRSLRFDPWVQKTSWRKTWQPTPVFLPGEIPLTDKPGGLQFMGFQELDMTQQLSTIILIESLSVCRTEKKFVCLCEVSGFILCKNNYVTTGFNLGFRFSQRSVASVLRLIFLLYLIICSDS